MSRDINPFGVRMPDDLKQRLEKEAHKAGRSLNAEIVDRLENSLPFRDSTVLVVAILKALTQHIDEFQDFHNVKLSEFVKLAEILCDDSIKAHVLRSLPEAKQFAAKAKRA